MTPLIATLVSSLGSPVVADGREVRFPCPFCNSLLESKEHKYSLHVNPAKEKWFCFRCEAGGSLPYLVKKLGLEWSAPDVPQGVEEILTLLQEAQEPPEKDEEVPPAPVLSSLSDTALQYLQERGITDSEVQYFSIREGAYSDNSKLDLSGRVVFPDYSREWKLEYWAARSFIGARNKYRNAPVPRRRKVFNLRSCRNEAWICEGPISAVVASRTLGRAVVATYGKHVTDSQIRRVVDSGIQRATILFDGDAVLPSFTVASAFREEGIPMVRVARFQHPQDDPASVTPEELRRVESEAVEYDPLEHFRVLLELLQGKRKSTEGFQPGGKVDSLLRELEGVL